MHRRRAHIYKEGTRSHEVSLDEAEPTSEDKSFIWVDLHDPEEKEVAALQERFGLHNLAVEDATTVAQAPKLDLYNNQIFVILKTATLDDDKIEYGEMAIFVGNHHIITVRHGVHTEYHEYCERLENSPTSFRFGTDFILHAMYDFVVDSYLPVVQMVEDSVLAMEQQMLDTSLTRKEITRIFKLRREVIHFQHVLGRMSEVCGKLVHLDVPCIGHEVKPYFSDVLDNLLRLDVRIGGLIDVITSVFEASNLLEQQSQNVITRQLAAWAGILAVPTAIAGIYGMNFKNMPELDFAYGYYIILGIMGISCVAIYFQFRRSGWL